MRLRPGWSTYSTGAGELDWYLGDSQPTEWTLRYEEGDTPVAQAERIRRLFSDAGALLRPYADEQVGYGVNSLVVLRRRRHRSARG